MTLQDFVYYSFVVVLFIRVYSVLIVTVIYHRVGKLEFLYRYGFLS